MSTNLNTKSVPWQGRTLVVSQATLRMNMRMIEMAQESSESLGSVTPIEAHFRLDIYPRLAACTTAADEGSIPTPDEFLDGIDIETNEWYVAAVQLNPHWFPDTNVPEAQQEEVKKKKSRSRRGVRPAA